MNRAIVLGVCLLAMAFALPLRSAEAFPLPFNFTAPPGDSTRYWLTNVDTAKHIAQAENKLILLNFSGSDWCAPCIRLEREIFADPVFQAFAADHLVLLKADFPRQRKNRLPEAQVQLNEALAEAYNAQGAFPLTILLDAHGQVLARWEGLWTTDAQQAVHDISAHFTH